MYRKNQEHTVEIPMFTALGVAITTGSATVELSVDSGSYGATTNSLTHVDEELWTITITVAEANHDCYRLRVTHDDLPATIIYTDQAVGTVGDVTDDMDANSTQLASILEDTAAMPSATSVAEAIAKLDLSTVEGAAAAYSLCTYLLAALGGSVASGTLTIPRTDGETEHATATVTSDSYGRVSGISDLTLAGS